MIKHPARKLALAVVSSQAQTVLRTLSALAFVFNVATTGSAALPSQGLSALKQTGANLNSHQDGYDKQQKSFIDKMDKGNQTELDDATPSYPQKYGSSQHGGMQPTQQLDIDVPAPQKQAQKEVKPKSADNQSQMATELSYFNMGGKNIAIPGPPPGKPWYHLPMDNTNITEKGQLAHMGYGKAAFSMFPKWNRSGLETSSQHQITQMIGAIMQAQMTNSPAMKVNQARANNQAQQQGASDASANVGENSLDTSITCFRQTLINVANEQSGAPGGANAPFKTIEQAVGMVQQMFKKVYIPMGILLLLPGALLTNLKGIVSFGILGNMNDEDAVSPFTGIMRTMIAVFLIPSTQLIISWATDMGNSMTYEVQKYLQPAQILDWAKEQTFDAPIKNSVNHLPLPKGGDLAGKIDDVSEKESKVEQQGAATRMMQMYFNFMNMALGLGMMILLAFQVVMMCYLLLMGPIAAAFFAWPASCGSLFKSVFTNWVDAVTNLALWRFWWCIVLLCAQTRLEWLQESGGFNTNVTWEMAIFTAFMVMLTYVPFVPFEYKPGEMVSKILEKASEAQQGGGGGGGGGQGTGQAGNSAGAANGTKTGGAGAAQGGRQGALTAGDAGKQGKGGGEFTPPPRQNGQPVLENAVYRTEQPLVPPPPPQYSI